MRLHYKGNFTKVLIGVLVLFAVIIVFYFGGSMIETISDDFGLSLNELIMGDITVKMKIIAIVLLKSGTYWLSRT